ncbi:hypothetical protein M422DRAFT_784313 [Sphaerobolus stellatus SS14]|uniref:Uncharacterized protein n=1 Tax=Sphaerobolus stellatus (strain SS14) TaxID=990650 RepID=A0A0C9TI99_SPHS4|nr:hypothetical protein M422DRAFT_784313 [Sphaerobolus stellatus SS14]
MREEQDGIKEATAITAACESVLREGSYGSTRGQDVNESITLKEFWLRVVRGIKMEDGFPIHDSWTFELASNKTVIPPTDDPVTTMFDDGENVYVKVYDEEGMERVYDFGTETWEFHVPGKHPPCFEDQIDSMIGSWF